MKKMIRFVVTGEGPTDYGKIIYDESKKIYRWEEGPIFSIIRHTAEKTGKKVELEAVDKKEVERKARMFFHILPILPCVPVQIGFDIHADLYSFSPALYPHHNKRFRIRIVAWKDRRKIWHCH